MSSPDVAQMYGIPLRTVQAACRAGSIKAQRFGRMWLIPADQAAAYAELWRPRHPRNGKEVMNGNGHYPLEEQDVVRQDAGPGRAVWTVGESAPSRPAWTVEKNGGGNRRVLRPSKVVEFDEYQPRAWEEVNELFEVSRLVEAETPNGPGSTTLLTKGIQTWLPEMFKSYGIQSVLDAPCGDWNWMRLVDLTGIHYTGWDAVSALVEKCADRCTAATIAGTATHASVMLEVVNLLTVPQVPKVDLILSRDFLAHLPNEPVQKVLEKFKASGSRYLLTSHYPDADNDFVYNPQDFHWIGYAERPINLEKAPFSLGRKLEACPEETGPAGVIAERHELALFEL